MRATMKTILSVALVLGFCGLAGAQDEKASPVGTWQCDYEIGGMKRTSTLTINKEGDKLVGSMSWPDQKDETIKDPKFKDGKLTFSAVRKFMGNTIPIDYTLTIDGDKLAGTMSWPDQKETNLKDLKLKDGELTFSAERMVMDNKFNVEYKLTVTGDKLKGKGSVEAGGEKREFDIEGKREKKDK